MKKTIILFVTFLLFCTHIHAQKFRIGVQGGVGISTFNVDQSEDYDAFEQKYLGIAKEYLVFSNAINLYVSYKIKDNWGIAAEPGFIRKGSGKKVSIDNVLYRNNTLLNYFQIPLLAEIYLDENITLAVGPELAFLLKANQSSKLGNLETTNNYNDRKIDLGVQLSFFYTFAKHFDVGVKGGSSLLKIGDAVVLN